LDGLDTHIGGTGTISKAGNIQIQGGNKTILSSADLSVTNATITLSLVDVTNNGIITINNNILGSAGTENWTNANNSTLNYGGTDLSSIGTLFASASDNTVNYYSSNLNQTIKCPQNGQYWHLITSGTTTKTLECDININGNLSVYGSSQLDVSSYNITIAGNWTNTSTNADAFFERTQTVTFNSSVNQRLICPGGESFYNLTIAKSGGLLILKNNVTVSSTAGGILTLTSGILKTGLKTLTLGTDIANESIGDLSYSSGWIDGKFQRWINTTGNFYLFPIGTASYYRGDSIQFNALTGGSLVSEFVATNPGIAGLYLIEGTDSIYNTFNEGYWQLTATDGLLSNDYDLRLTGNGFLSYTINPETRILYRANAPSDWSLKGNHQAATANTAKRNGITSSLAQYCLGDDTPCTPPANTISGADSVCINSAGEQYTITDHTPNIYTWLCTGGTINPAPSPNDDTIYVDWGSTGGTGKVQMVEKDNCGDGDTVTLNVNIHPLPASSITGKITGLSQYGPEEPYTVIPCRPGYSYEWSIAQNGGTILSGQGSCTITIKWDSTGLDTVRVVPYVPGCDSADAVKLPVNIYGTIVSIQSGNWDDILTWDCNCEPLAADNVVIDTGHTVTLNENDTINFLIISDNATLDNNGYDFWVTYEYTVKGTHTGNGDIYLNGNGVSISGYGTISNTGNLQIDSNKNIYTSADIIRTNGQTTIGAGFTVTNDGIFTNTTDIIGGGAGSTWINSNNATLNIGGAMLSTGIFVASASGNTVNYNSSVARNIKCPGGGQYYHLTSSGSDTKTLECNIDVDGNLKISGSSQLDVDVANDYSITLAGNWLDSSSSASSFIEQQGLVTLNGAGSQSIYSSSGEMYYNLTINNGGLILNNNVTVSNTLIMTLGNINSGTDTLTLGTSITNVGTLIHSSDNTIIGKFQRWINSTGMNILYPVGTSSDYRPALVNFINLTSGSLVSEFIVSNPGNNGLPMTDGPYIVGNAFTEGYWRLDAFNSLASSDYDLDLVGTNFSSYPIIDKTHLIRRVDAASGWDTTNAGFHINTAGDTAKRRNLNNISGYEFGFGSITGCSNYPPTSAITGKDSVCEGQTGVIYYVEDHPPNTYIWQLIPTSSGSIVADNGDSITVDWGTTGQSAIVRVVEIDDCHNRDPVDKSVDIHVFPTSSISGSGIVGEYTSGNPYSVIDNGYTYTWSILGDSGIVATGQGTANITVNWLGQNDDTLQVIASNGGCGTDTAILNITIHGVILSVQTGNWTDINTWNCNCVPELTDNVIIDANDTVTLTHNDTINNLTINTGGTLDNATYYIRVTGNYTVNGTHTGSGDINLTGNNTTIDGTGTINTSGTFYVQNYDKVILSTARLTRSGNFNISNDKTVTNNGAITIDGNLSGGTTSKWNNNANSYLGITGTLLSTGILNASGASDTVEYNGGGNQTIKMSAPNYYHLLLSNSNTKTLADITDINGELVIKNTVTMDCFSKNFSLAGNFTNNGNFNAGTNTVTFDGTTTIGGTSVTNFNNIKITNAGNLTGHSTNMGVAGSWINDNVFNHNNGTVTFNGNTTIGGTSATSFNNIEITNTGNLTGHSTNMGVAGSWINDNVFNHNNGTVTFNGNTTIGGTSVTDFNNIKITNTGNLTGHSTNMGVAGSWINDNVFNHNNGTVTFNGNTTIGGTSATSFNNIEITNTGNLTGYNGNMWVNGNWVNNGTYNHNSGKVIFSSVTTVSGDSVTDFNHIEITNTGNLTGHSVNMGVAGIWTRDNVFNPNNGTVTFNGFSNIGGSVINTFNNVNITSGATVIAPAAIMNITGNLSNNGTYTHSSGQVNFNGTDTISGNSIINFNNITITGTLIAHSDSMQMNGNWINNGTFIHNNGKVRFSGITTIFGSGTNNFNHLTITGTLNNAAGETIGVAGDWNNSGTFTHNNGTVIFNGAFVQSVQGTNITSFYDLTVNNSSNGIVIDKNIIVKDTLQLVDGDIDLKNDSIDLGTTGTLTGETEGNRIKVGDSINNTGIIKTTKTVNNVIDFNPANLGLEITTDQDLGSITIVRGHQRQQGTGSFTANYGIARYFDIPGIGEIDSSNVNIKLKYWDAELSGHTEANLVQYQSVTQSSNTWWTPLTGTVDTIVNLYTPASHPYTSYIYGSAYSYVYFSNRFTLGSTDIPLPIELLSFDAKLKDDIVELTWTTASEINNDYFTIEKTKDGKTFEQVATIKGAGTSNEVINYFAIDENPYQYISYYRLKQTDFDGKYKYSDLVSVNNPHKYNYNNNGLIVYPNPSKSKNFYIKINEQVINEKILINIYDIFCVTILFTLI
jgi:hypothetical protein